MFIIFDYDGTLSDTFEFNYQVIKKYLATQKITKFTKKYFVWIGVRNPFERFKEFGLLEKQIKGLVLNLEKESLKNKSTLIFPGIKNIIKKLSKNNKIIVITSNTDKVVKKFLKKNKLEKYILEILGADSETSKVKKIKSIIKKYKVKKSDIIYIGDTAGDIYEAKMAGVKTLAVTWGFSYLKYLKASKPDYLINDPKQILKVIDKI
jgi:phosphoglycolate phosphatase